TTNVTVSLGLAMVKVWQRVRALDVEVVPSPKFHQLVAPDKGVDWFSKHKVPPRHTEKNATGTVLGSIIKEAIGRLIIFIHTVVEDTHPHCEVSYKVMLAGVHAAPHNTVMVLLVLAMIVPP